MQVSAILQIADRLPLQRLRYRVENERWYYRAPNQSRITEHPRSDGASLRELAELLRAKENLTDSRERLEEVLEYIRSQPDVWTNRGSQQEPELPRTHSAGR
jgi:hypothetical protein